jgi:hypothetical protein
MTPLPVATILRRQLVLPRHIADRVDELRYKLRLRSDTKTFLYLIERGIEAVDQDLNPDAFDDLPPR